MSGVSILRVGEKKDPFESYRNSASPGRKGVLSESIKVSRYASFAAL
jgi:hypothetical protein